MTSVSTTPSRPRPARSRNWPRVWLRVLVILLALLMPGAPVAAAGLPVVVAATPEVTEGDPSEAALRPVTRGPRPPVVTRRPTPPGPAPVRPPLLLPVPPSPYPLSALRCVVLRC
jgi:hypothetical protein